MSLSLITNMNTNIKSISPKSPRRSICDITPALLGNRSKLFRACTSSQRVYNIPDRTDVIANRFEDTLYVTFKGCSTMNDFINSIDIRKCKIHGEDVGIHNGFCEKYKHLYNTVWYNMLDNLATGQVNNVVFAGHSAGGSIAQIMSLFTQDDLKLNNINSYCFTFGTPKTGDKSFKDAMEYSLGDNLLRVEIYNDLVCMLPMQPAFVHAGNSLILKHGEIFDTDTYMSEAREKEFFSYYYNDYVKLMADMSSHGLLDKHELGVILGGHSCESYTTNLSHFFRHVGC